MRPDLVRRMVLDGVGDSESYFNDVLQWGKDDMAETHKVRWVCRCAALKVTEACFRRLPDSYQPALRLAPNIVPLQFRQASPARPRLQAVSANV